MFGETVLKGKRGSSQRLKYVKAANLTEVVSLLDSDGVTVPKYCHVSSV